MNDFLYIVWKDDSKNLGIPIIDEQHRALVSIINSLYFFIKEKKGCDVLAPIMKMLEQYTKIHFQTEEYLLRKACYPELDKHLALHKELIDKMDQIGCEASMRHDPEMVLTFLKDWWLGHIRKEDIKYVTTIKERL